MSIEYTSRTGKLYFLHIGKTIKGNDKYFFSSEPNRNLAQSIPKGYEIYENVNAQVFLIKVQPKIIQDEEDLGFLLVNSFSEVQKQKAIFQLQAFADIVTTNSVKVNRLNPVGIYGRDMTHAQKTVLNKLIVAYLLSMPKAIAKIRMEKITSEDLNLVSFGWAGETKAGKPHYFRVQGKSFLIEFDNTQNRANHIHTVWRDFNGDFGADLLSEHYQDSHHN